MGKSKEDIIKEITAYLATRGVGSLDVIYVGIADDVEKRLFTDHRVEKDGGIWIYRQANSSDCAREVEKYLLDRGAQGGPGGGSDETNYVYAYKIEPYTKE